MSSRLQHDHSVAAWFVPSPMSRYAIYYAPRPEEPLAVFAAQWLGRDPGTGFAIPQPVSPGLPPGRLAAITADPRHYGFHGTLKAPFALAEGATEDALLALAADFARRHDPCLLPSLELRWLDGFIALVPHRRAPAVERLAADCVRAFDPFRAPIGDGDLARRREAGLTPHQDELLRRWGYPYVLDEFRFHLTLTGRLGEEDRHAAWLALERLTAPLRGAPVEIRDLVVFTQDHRDQPFRVLQRFRLGTV